MPCYHRLDKYLHAYIDQADIQSDPKGFLFRYDGQQSRYWLDRKSAVSAGCAYDDSQPSRSSDITTPRVGCHSLRATGITAHMKNGGRLEVAQQIANHESPRTTKLYDRRGDEISIHEIERIVT